MNVIARVYVAAAYFRIATNPIPKRSFMTALEKLPITGTMLALVLLLTHTACANDGVYRSNGGVIYPVQETSIVLAKEHLSFVCRDHEAQVDVRFEFINPDPVPKKLLVGFQAPSAYDPHTMDPVTNLIGDFRIMHLGALLPYRLMAATCEDCPLQDTALLHFEPENRGVYVYLFDITFQPGINTIQHSYTFPASGGVMLEESYDYILRTGSKWADHKIHELTVDIDMGPDRNFEVHDGFGPDSEWFVIGTGRIDDPGDRSSSRQVRILSGKLRITAKDLVPDDNISFFVESSNCLSGYFPEQGGMREEWWSALCQAEPDVLTTFDPPLTVTELRLLRNTIYAQHGLPFKDPDLQRFFEQFNWYIADPNTSASTVQLSGHEKRFIEAITALEKR